MKERLLSPAIHRRAPDYCCDQAANLSQGQDLLGSAVGTDSKTEYSMLSPRFSSLKDLQNQLQVRGPLSKYSISSSQTFSEHSNSKPRRDTVQPCRRCGDKLLVLLRQAGLSYGEIKESVYNRDARSTLRGRFRALKKGKEQRVRKSQWHKSEVSDLLGAH